MLRIGSLTFDAKYKKGIRSVGKKRGGGVTDFALEYQHAWRANEESSSVSDRVGAMVVGTSLAVVVPGGIAGAKKPKQVTGTCSSLSGGEDTADNDGLYRSV